MEEWLCDAAMRGDLESLHNIIAKDNYILDKVLVGSFKGKNPLHVATSTQQAEFVLKLLEIKPKLAEVIDAELGAALHIASANGDLKIVEALVKLSPEMCMARDRDGYNPLHIAAMKGKVDVLKKLVQTCPRAIQVIVDRGDTILHLCVNYNQLESLQLLLEIEMIRDSKLVQSKDANGNTILHVAVLGRRFEIVERVLNSTEINVKAINEAGWSVLDCWFFVQNRPHREDVDACRIENLLRAKRQIKHTISPKGAEYLVQTLSVVSSLFATMAFQVGVNPPGGVWQDDSKEHLAGKAILAYKYPNLYSYVMYFNTAGFLLSLFIIIELQVFHVPGRIGCWVWVLPMTSLFTIMTTVFTYTYSVIVVLPKHTAINNKILVLVIVWAFLILLYAVWRMVVTECARPKDRAKISRSARDRQRLLPNAVGENVSSV